MTVDLLAGALALAVVPPVVWWLVNRRRVDVWAALPVPAALVDRAGRVRRRTGPDYPETDLRPAGGLPPAGVAVRVRSATGGPLAVTGLADGALAVSLPADPVADARDRLVGELAGRFRHDLATPLAAVGGYLELLHREPLSPTGRQALGVAAAEVARLGEFGHDLLTLATARAGSLRRVPYRATALVEEAVAGLLGEAAQVAADVDVQTPVEPVWVLVAPGELVRVLRNLVVNGLRHGLGDDPAARLVTVALTAGPTEVTFTVADHGPGLTDADLARLTEPGVRGSTAVAGHGLGLAIARELLAAHGAVLAADRWRGQPAVTFRLPRVDPVGGPR